MSTNTSWLQQQIKEREDYKNEGKYQRRITFKSVICHKTVKGWIFLSVFASVAPILVYYFIIDQGTYKTNDSSTCSVKNSFRVPCGKINISSTDCENLQCCFEKSSQSCYHYLPSKYSYDLNEETNEYITSRTKTPYGTESIHKLHISINEIDKNKVSIILHETRANVEIRNITGDKNYEVILAKQKLMVEIYRSSNNDLLLSTTKGPLIASTNYWEWSFYLTSEFLFGLNQTVIRLDENSTLSKVIYRNKNDHYTLPVFWAYNNKQFHGVVIKHDGPIEITVLPSYMILLKSLTGEQIELEVSVGPTPIMLHDQQLTTSDLPPYWALDTYTCRKSDNVNLTQLLQQYNLEYSGNSDCIHENLYAAIMTDNGRNIDEVRNITTQLKEKGIKFLLSIPPHIFRSANDLYENAKMLDILYKYNQSVYQGKYFKQEVVYPDYSHSNIQSYMAKLNEFLASYIDIEDIDGFVLYDNWPGNDVYQIENSSFPYLPEALQEAMSNTVPWNATVYNGTILHVQKHNNYGSAQIDSIKAYYNSSKSELFLMSASKTFGQIQPTFIQNINSSWNNLKDHIDNALFNSIVGNHLVNVPVCGDTSVYSSSLQETLCIRWYLVAATMPMFRIGSNNPYRDPQNLNSVFAQQAAERAIQRRKLLLSYYYTLLSRNEPVIRPMFYDYYDNTTTFSLKRQYMIGQHILVAHPFSTGRTKLHVYLPSRIGIWYEIWGGEMYNTTKDPWIHVDVVETDFVAFISQGTILPLLVDNTLNFIIALNCTTNPCAATGTLFQDSYMNFMADETAITVLDIPKENCNYTVANVTLYLYTEQKNVVRLYNKQNDLCGGENNMTIGYEAENEIFM